MIARRGSVLVESAFVLTLLLLLLYGALQLGIVGLEQLTADGGAFTAAHQQSFLSGKVAYEPAAQLARDTLPHLTSANSSITFAKVPPPATAFNGQYNFNQPNARYGGVSLVQPLQTLATVTRSNIASIVMGATNASLGVTGLAVEPMYQVVNPHFDVGGNNFGTAAAFATAADPLSDSPPPFFVGFNYIQTCPYSVPGNRTTTWTTCPSGAVLTALGSAEYLDVNNWQRATNGVTPDLRAVFWEMRYHQGLYASLSHSLVVADNAGAANVVAAKKRTLDPQTNTDVACVYSFDNNNVGAYAAGSIGIGDPLFALHPDGSAGGSACPAP